MKCPQCVKEGKASKLYYEYGTSTDMSVEYYYDEEGGHHRHDPNTHSEVYHCSNGHRVVIGKIRGCKACGRVDQVTTAIHK